MSYNPNSSREIIQGTAQGVIKGDARSLDYGSHWVHPKP